jgi:hypothetical protein
MLYLAYKNLSFKDFIKRIYASLRLRYLVYFRPKYVITQLLNRKGKCTLEGCCCNSTTWFCEHFQNGKYKIYNNQPFFCRIFPIDQKDIKLSNVENKCGYSWKK